MSNQSKRATVATSAIAALAFAVGVAASQGFDRATASEPVTQTAASPKAGDGVIQQAQIFKKKGLLFLFKCTSKFNSTPSVVKMTAPNQTKSYLCTTNIPACPKTYQRTTAPYGSADNSFHFDCGVPVKCAKGYNLVAHQQSASKFQYKCELPIGPAN